MANHPETRSAEKEINRAEAPRAEESRRIESEEQFQQFAEEQRNHTESLLTTEQHGVEQRAHDILQRSGLSDTPEAQLLIAAQQREIAQRGTQALESIDAITGVPKAEKPAAVTARNTLEQSMEGRDVSPERGARALEMAQRLDTYVESHTDALIADAIARNQEKGGKQSPEEIATRIRAQVERSREFFAVVDSGKRSETPLERMAKTYEHLEPPTDPLQRETFSQAISEHMEEMVSRAFDQQLDNPEQYVSHGFDHTLNVADYAESIVELNPTVIDATAQKYGISAGEAKFMLEQVAMLHDVGYPRVGERAKSVHGIAGADIASAPKMQSIFDRLITTPGAQKDKLNHDLRDSIMFHSADKVERSFGAKVETTRGTFLADENNIIEVLSTFNDPEQNSENIPRDTVEIFVSSEDSLQKIQTALEAARSDTTRKTGTIPAEVKVTLVSDQFRGRSADLKKKDDGMLGLEYSEVDALAAPLESIIRLADNMDMRSNRFSQIQHEPAFREIYQTLGDGQETSLIAKKLEDLAKKEKNKELSPQEVQDQIQTLMRIVQEGNPNQALIPVDSMTRATDAEKAWKNMAIEGVLSQPEYAALPPEKRAAIAKIAAAQSSESMRHFGGCESIQDVRVETTTDGRAVVRVTVDRAQFEQLNQTVVQEKSLDTNGVPHRVNVGIGEYQVWRAEEAYSSISLGGKKVDVMVVDKDGHEIIPHYRQVSDESLAAEEFN